MELVGTPAPYVNLTFIAQIMRAMVDTIKSAWAPTTLVASVVASTLVVTTLIDNVVSLVSEEYGGDEL